MVNFSWLRLLRGFYLEWSKILENGWQYVLATSTVVCFSCILSLLSSKVTRGTTAEYKSCHLWNSKKNAKLLSAVKILEKDNIQLFHKPPSLIHGYTEWTWNKLKAVSNIKPWTFLNAEARIAGWSLEAKPINRLCDFSPPGSFFLLRLSLATLPQSDQQTTTFYVLP